MITPENFLDFLCGSRFSRISHFQKSRSLNPTLHRRLNHNSTFQPQLILFPGFVPSIESLDIDYEVVLAIRQDEVGVPPLIHIDLE